MSWYSGAMRMDLLSGQLSGATMTGGPGVHHASFLILTIAGDAGVPPQIHGTLWGASAMLLAPVTRLSVRLLGSGGDVQLGFATARYQPVGDPGCALRRRHHLARGRALAAEPADRERWIRAA